MSRKPVTNTILLLLWTGLIILAGCQKQAPLRELAFVSDRDGNQDIYLLNMDADSLVALTYHEAEDWSPAWHPDGSVLAFSSTRDQGWNIYLLTLSNRSVVRLTDSGQDRRPAWSPDGKKIAFTSDRDGDMEVYVMNADGSDPSNLSRYRGRDDWPAWSPDGREIAFASNRDGEWQIYLVTLASGAVRKLTEGQRPHVPGVWFRRGDQQYLLLESNFDIAIYDFATGEMRRVDATSSQEGNPDRSGDGEWIVFESDRSGDSDIWCMRSDGSEVQNITQHPAFDWYPRWRPGR